MTRYGSVGIRISVPALEKASFCVATEGCAIEYGIANFDWNDAQELSPTASVGLQGLGYIGGNSEGIGDDSPVQ